MIDDFLTYAIISVIIGGRIGYVVFYNFNFYLNNPFEILKIWNGGMSFHGGFLGIIVAMVIFSRIKKILFFLIWLILLLHVSQLDFFWEE